jgi:uncharacterized membrane protein YkoI
MAALLGVAALLGGAAVQAQPDLGTLLAQRDDANALFPTQRMNPPRPGGGASISLAQAQQIALSRHPGRVVRAATFMQGDRVIHEVRILDGDNRVRTVLIDGQTGAFL